MKENCWTPSWDHLFVFFLPTFLYFVKLIFIKQNEIDTSLKKTYVTMMNSINELTCTVTVINDTGLEGQY